MVYGNEYKDAPVCFVASTCNIQWFIYWQEITAHRRKIAGPLMII